MYILELIVGHTSSRLTTIPENGHTHKWTLFVKPANKEYEDFPDNKLIQKVRFQIHESFAQPTRVVTKPPFKITETGFASFSTVATVYLNLPHDKPRNLPYELKLYVGDHDNQMQLQKLALKPEDVPAWYVELIKKYGKSKKRKASTISSSNDEKSPQEQKKYQKEKMTPAREEYDRYKTEKDSSKPKKSKEREVSKIDVEKAYESPKKKDKKDKTYHRESSSEPKSEKVKSPEELTKRLNECSDSYVIYKASEFLLTLPDTRLSSSTLRLTFDLSKCSNDTLAEIGRILKSKKSKSRSKVS